MHPFQFAGRPGRPGDAVIVTGASTGLGLEIALHLAGNGFRVYATVPEDGMRADVERAASERGVELSALRLDLTDAASIAAAVETVTAECGGVYGLVNNGGIGLRGAIEDCTDQEVRRVFEVNVLGTISVTRAVLPHMRAAGCGRVVTITSIGGRVPGYGVTSYCSTKWAQEGFAEGLALEVAAFGIQSIVVEPGMIKTSRWNEHRGTAAGAQDPASPYHAAFWASEAVADRIVERSPTKPSHVAAGVLRALTDERPRMRYVVGAGARVVIQLRRHLPDRLFERLYYGRQLQKLRERAASAPSPAAATPAPPLERVP